MTGRQGNEIRAVAYAAVAEALRSARGWLRLTSRMAVADAVVAAVEPLIRADERARVAAEAMAKAGEVTLEAGLDEAGTIAWIDDPHGGGFICAVRSPGLPYSICGEPVGVEACPEHGTYAGETP
jgi:hypothetical protein